MAVARFRGCLAILLCLLVLAACPQAVALAGAAQLQDQPTGTAAQTIQVSIEYEGAWVQVAKYGFRLYLPDGWAIATGGTPPRS